MKHFGILYLSLLLCIEGILAAHFKWDAGLDSKSGLAHSLERSSLLRSSKSITNNKPHPDLSGKVKEIFTSYPTFLGLRKCLLGAIVVKPVCLGDEGHPESLILTTQICDFLFGMNLLTFGQPTTVTYRSRKKSEKGNGNYSIENEVVTDLPIIGGLLACGMKNRKKGSSSTRIVGSPPSSYGSLRFKFTQSCENVVDDVPTEPSHESTEVLRLETRIIDYRPALAGPPPVGIMRKSFYLSTQRVLHAYVMWRFHNHCYVNL